MENYGENENIPIDWYKEMKYGEAFTTLRKMKGRTIMNLSENSGISIIRVQELESDIDKPTHKEIAIITKLLGINIKILETMAIYNSDIIKQTCGELADAFRPISDYLLQKHFIGTVNMDSKGSNSTDN